MVETIIKKHPKCLLVELSQSWFVNEHSAVNSLEFVELTPKLFSNSGPSRHSRPTWRERFDRFPGMEGLPGPKGDKGDSGPQGARGLKGDRGKMG